MPPINFNRPSSELTTSPSMAALLASRYNEILEVVGVFTAGILQYVGQNWFSSKVGIARIPGWHTVFGSVCSPFLFLRLSGAREVAQFMNVRTDLRPTTELTDEERAALRALATAVYPPEVEAAWPGRLIEWATRQWNVIVWDDTGSRALLVLTFVLSVGLVAADEDPDFADQPPDVPIFIQKVPISLLPVPEINLARPLKATEAEATEIKALIESLTQIEYDGACLGFGIVDAGYFPPIPLAQHVHGLGRITPHPSVKKLVEYGPKAVPFLLKALDDDSPLKMTFPTIDNRPSNDLHRNSANQSEVAVAKQMEAQPKNELESSDYTARVGDICFGVLGHITNRCYSFFTVDSPVENETLAKSIREIWGGFDPAEKLFQSLLIDFHTRGFDRKDLVIVGPNDSVEFQKGAAMRLAFYFPAEASRLIADRLKHLDLTNDINTNDITNGINAVEFVSAVSWSSDARITAEVLTIFEETANEQMFLACCPGIDKQHDDTVFQRAVEFLERQPLGEEEFGCLKLIAERFPGRAKKFFQEYLEVNSTGRRESLCWALMEEPCGELSIDVLSPLLSDKTETTSGHSAGGENPVFVNYRICDLAAEAISANFPDLYFGPSESYKSMDRHIAEMKRRIAEMKKAKK